MKGGASMRAHLQDETIESEGSDGFNLVPRNPKKVFLLKVNPLISHLPTELAGFKIRKWRVPYALTKMDDYSVVVFWQEGPNAGIYGIGVPFGPSFMTESYFFTPATRLEFYRYGFKEVKLRCIYMLPVPILSTSLQKKGIVVREMHRPLARLRTGCKLTKQAWNEIYDLMSHSRNPADSSAVAAAIPAPHPVVELVPRRENNVFFQDDETQWTDTYALAQRIWDVLTWSVHHEKSVSCSSLSKLFRAKPGEIRSVITLIDEICVLEHLPGLASSIVPSHESLDLDQHPQFTSSKSTQLCLAPPKPAAGYFDWQQIPNPFDFTLQCSSQEIMRELEMGPTLEQAADIYKVIKVRGTAQQIFARLMRRLYDRQCAFCGFSVPFALEAAHIKPWPFCTPGERLLPSNGLLLCSVHHKLFDAGLITLSKSRAKRYVHGGFVVRVLAPDGLLCISRADVDYVKKLDGVGARVPRSKELQPKAEFLDFRKTWLAERFFTPGLVPGSDAFKS
jgi:putative restriction endonuclease